MFNVLKRLFGGNVSGNSTAKPAASVEYAGFEIIPRPRQVANGWSTEADIKKTIGGESKHHAFIRADTSPTRDTAIELIISKAKVLIEQRGDGVFD